MSADGKVIASPDLLGTKPFGFSQGLDGGQEI
jgi:hypothetical protein